MTYKKLLGITLISLGLSLSTTAQADQLDDIKQRGELVCGTLGTSQPFSYLDNNTRTLIGYDIDFCKLIADKLGVKVTYKQLAVAARIPELTEKRVDILAANLGYSPERAEQIDFSHTYYVAAQRLMVRDNTPYDSIESLNGKRIAATKGSSSELEIKKRLNKSTVIGYNNSSAAYLALQQRKVESQFASELVLVRLVLESPPTSPVRVIQETVFDEPWGLGIRKGEPRLLAAVNSALEEAEANGEAAKIFEKWFGANTPYKLNRSFTIRPTGE